MKSYLRTIRFNPNEYYKIRDYLKMNTSFESISSLGRVAIMDFIANKQAMELRPLTHINRDKRPSFLWDYDLTEFQVHEILRHAPFNERKWLIGRILEHARFKEVFKYLSVQEIKEALPHLRLKPDLKRHWKMAVDLWTSPSKS
jgi:hypothetical protein